MLPLRCGIVGRQLTETERAVLVAMIRYGVGFEDQAPIRAADRKRWLHQVPDVLAGPECGCGTCPSIGLEDQHGPIPAIEPRVVLTAALPDALLLLFIDDDRLSYLELAPTEEHPITAFPAPAELLFDA